ncbi:MAG: trypsin-like peptidase domain-containing protein [Vicinamibacterales bacterium]
MAESESARFSRLCPACGRRVVRRVTTCRCGAALPVEPDMDAANGPDNAQTSGFQAAAIFGLALVVTVAFGVYWLGRTPAQPATALAVSDGFSELDNRAPMEVVDLPVTVPEGAVADLPPPSVAAPPSTPEREPNAAPTLALEDVIGRAMPAVVLVETPTARGSGFYVTPDTLLTNVHVVGANTTVTVKRTDGTSVMARVESRAPEFDIAVLKILSAAPGQVTIPLGHQSTLRQGQDLIVIGAPLGLLQNTVTRGIVSALRRSGTAILVQTDAAINPGNSGGPVLDRTGAAIGITTMNYGGSQGLNFAVSIDHARSILEGHAPTSDTALNTEPSVLRDLASPGGSAADAARAEGQRVYEETLDTLAKTATNYESDWRRFKDECYAGAIAGVFDREWFAVLASGAMPGTVSTQCSASFKEFKRNAGLFQDQMRASGEAARHAGVDPGPIRDARRSRRLDFAGWDR